jgi:D-alanyl-D-alanine carboxypeptidase
MALVGLLVAVVLAVAAVGPQVLGAMPLVAAAPTASPMPTPTPTPTPSPTPTPTPEPLPACTIADLPARHAGYDDWAVTLVDTSYGLDASYVPPDLVSVSEAGIPGGTNQVRSLVIDDLRALTEAAKAAGLSPRVNSAYRSYEDQAKVFNDLRAKYGLAYAEESAARPGHSEHQLGTAIDFGGVVGAWLAAHAWEYGFIGSYPADSSPGLTCYKPEAWHYRYFGRQVAREIHDSGLTAREWLWRNEP